MMSKRVINGFEFTSDITAQRYVDLLYMSRKGIIRRLLMFGNHFEYRDETGQKIMEEVY